MLYWRATVQYVTMLLKMRLVMMAREGETIMSAGEGDAIMSAGEGDTIMSAGEGDTIMSVWSRDPAAPKTTTARALCLSFIVHYATTRPPSIVSFL
jgi:hypothetical protein